MSRLRALDPRWFVFGNNALLLFWGLALFGLQRSALQIATCFGATIGSELALARAFRRDAPVFDRVLSAATAAVSTLILLVSPVPWFYALAGVVAIASKYLVKNATGKHVFNPTNFAIVFAVAFLPDDLLVRPDQFSGSPWLMAQVFVFGVLAVVRGARFRTTLGYYLAVVGFALPVGTALGMKPLWILAPEMNTSTLIFACLMITDPQTTPGAVARGPSQANAATGASVRDAHRRQIAFGGLVGLVHLSLRYLQVPYSPFIALFVVTGVRSCFAVAAVDRRAPVTT
jgi:NQR2/RnfD/RnfE family subunit of NADH-ubiquinone oxidoreductase